MGLDQYAYAKDKNGEDEHLADWRKHNRLQGWMEDLWHDKGKPNAPEEESPMGDFNCIPLELTLSDLEQLEAHIDNKSLPQTGGFFFGQDSYTWEDEDGNSYGEDDYFHKETDLKFVQQAYKALAKGKKVYYNCWW